MHYFVQKNSFFSVELMKLHYNYSAENLNQWKRVTMVRTEHPSSGPFLCPDYKIKKIGHSITLLYSRSQLVLAQVVLVRNLIGYMFYIIHGTKSTGFHGTDAPKILLVIYNVFEYDTN